MLALNASSAIDITAMHRSNCARRVLFFAIIAVYPVFAQSNNQPQTAQLGTASHDVLCSNGFSSFDTKFATGVSVSVGSVKSAGLATRHCEAKLQWGKHELVIEPDAAQLDIDLLGANLGLGSPVFALQIKKYELDSLMKYQIYSLANPPKLLRTITGGDFFLAADTDLDGRIEIWTHDAGAVNDFEGIPLSALDFAPTVVLRFEQQRLVDVGSEFPAHFDGQIALLRARLDAQQLSDFKHSDGKLSPLTFAIPADKFHSLRATKIQVLEIVWCYLYSGREHEAWQALAEMWPPADFERIQTSIRDARARGIRSQVDEVSPGFSRFHITKHALVYDRVTDNGQEHQLRMDGQSPKEDHMRIFEVDTNPEPILLRRPPPPAATTAFLNTEVVLNLVIDAAGKVRSAKMEGKPDQALLDATADWKFIPGFKDGVPVACRLRFGVTPYQ